MNLEKSDHPNIISRVFKLKFDELLSDLTKKCVMGKVLACKCLFLFVLYHHVLFCTVIITKILFIFS